jgi:hypothetical protein
MKKRESIILNLLIIILEIIGLVLSFKEIGKSAIMYYTQLSNIFLLIASILYLVFLDEKRRFVSIIKYSATVSVIITFLVVLFILGPTYDFNYNWLLFGKANIFYHLLCPILGFISFTFYEQHNIGGAKDYFYSMLFTLIYSVVMITLNIANVVDGPYLFLRVTHNSIIESLLWIVIIIGGAFVLTYLLSKLKNKVSN